MAYEEETHRCIVQEGHARSKLGMVIVDG